VRTTTWLRDLAAHAAVLALAASCTNSGMISGSGADGGAETGADGSVLPDASIPPGSNTPTVLADGSECFEGSYTPFWGDLHTHLKNHTDPVTCDNSAQELFDAGVERGLNFLHITEHVWRLTATGLSACKEAAAASTTATFRPGCGFETNVVMADGSYSGHANAFFAPNNHNTDTSDSVGEDFFGAGGKGAFYAYVADAQGIGQINHPNSDEDGWPDRARQHADDSIDVVEVSGSCGGCADRDAAAITTFLQLVEEGWRIGPSMNSDTHCLTPGRRTGLWVVEGDQPVIGAIDGHRTFVQSYDPEGGRNNQLSMHMAKPTDDGETHQCWIGSRLARPEGGAAVLRVRLRGPMVTDGVPGSIAVKIFARGHGVASPLASAVCGADESACTCDGDGCVWQLEGVETADTGWLVAYAESTVGEARRWSLTSPIWLF
jgi:hypothetical protein